MLTNFQPLPEFHARSIRLDWTWADTGDRPAFRLKRRLSTFPDSVTSGVDVVDLAALFRSLDHPWAEIEVVQFHVPNVKTTGPLLQDEAVQSPEPTVHVAYLLQAEVVAFFGQAQAPQPQRIVLRIYDTSNDRDEVVQIDQVTRVARDEQIAPPWKTVTTITIFVVSGNGSETAIGAVTVKMGHSDLVTADQFTWVPAVGSPLQAEFDQVAAFVTEGSVITQTDNQYRAEFLTVRASQKMRTAAVPDEQLAALVAQASANHSASVLAQIIVDDYFDQDSGDWQRHTMVTEGDLAQATHYYSLFWPDATAPGGYSTSAAARSVAEPTGSFDLSAQMYRLLPAVHKQYDEPPPGEQGDGQLRRFLDIYGSTLDHARSLAERLTMRHDPYAVRADLVPALSRLLGWEPDQTLDVLAQRRDIRFAPEIYSTTGTGPNLSALVNRMTGWECRIKEFGNNVFLTNAPETIQLWELWEQRQAGGAWIAPHPVTHSDGLDGRPSAVRAGDDTVWLFWHARRNHRREIWLQRQDGIDGVPRRAAEGTTDDVAGAQYVDESPAATVVSNRIWLAWSSNRDGNWEIYARPYDGLPGATAFRVTDHPAEDRAPVTVAGQHDTLWIFWQSNRRGPTDIWARAFHDDTWSTPARITAADFRHVMPAALVDNAARLWLFWSADLGDRSNLFASTRASSAWVPGASLTAEWQDAQQITQGQWHDEAPAAVLVGGNLWLYWHSDRGGQWQIWAMMRDMMHDDAQWSPPSPLVAEITGDKEPTAIVDAAGVLRLYWRSQRRGRTYESRTVDTSDPEMLQNLRTFADRAHYTYQPGEAKDDWYSRSVAGVYLSPDTNDNTVIADRRARAKSFVELFRPAHVRLVWIPDDAG